MVEHLFFLRARFGQVTRRRMIYQTGRLGIQTSQRWLVTAYAPCIAAGLVSKPAGTRDSAVQYCKPPSTQAIKRMACPARVTCCYGGSHRAGMWDSSLLHSSLPPLCLSDLQRLSLHRPAAITMHRAGRGGRLLSPPPAPPARPAAAAGFNHLQPSRLHGPNNSAAHGIAGAHALQNSLEREGETLGRSCLDVGSAS